MTQKTMEIFGLIYTEKICRPEDKLFIVDDVFELLTKAYAKVEGGLLFSDEDELLSKTGVWQVIYRNAEIIGVVVYKAKKGTKMVAIAAHEKFKQSAKAVFSTLFRKSFARTWMEVSEGVERYMMKLGAEKFLIPNKYAARLTEKEIVALCEDGYHYERVINGVIKRKVIVGIPKEW